LNDEVNKEFINDITKDSIQHMKSTDINETSSAKYCLSLLFESKFSLDSIEINSFIQFVNIPELYSLCFQIFSKKFLIFNL
jgi:hypothetical protein